MSFTYLSTAYLDRTRRCHTSFYDIVSYLAVKYGRENIIYINHNHSLIPGVLSWEADFKISSKVPVDPSDERFLRSRTFIPLPEISTVGNRRCIAVNNGKRCKKYSQFILCKDCQKVTNKLALLRPDVKDIVTAPVPPRGYTAYIRDTTLQSTHDTFKRASHSVVEELALMRTLLASLLARIPEGSNGALPLDLIEFASRLTRDIAQVSERVEKMQLKMGQRITIEQVEEMMVKVIAIVQEELSPSPEQLYRIADKVGALNIKINPNGVLSYEEVYQEFGTTQDQASLGALKQNADGTVLRALKEPSPTLQPYGLIGNAHDNEVMNSVPPGALHDENTEYTEKGIKVSDEPL